MNIVSSLELKNGFSEFKLKRTRFTGRKTGNNLLEERQSEDRPCYRGRGSRRCREYRPIYRQSSGATELTHRRPVQIGHLGFIVICNSDWSKYRRQWGACSLCALHSTAGQNSRAQIESVQYDTVQQEMPNGTGRCELSYSFSTRDRAADNRTVAAGNVRCLSAKRYGHEMC